MEEFQNVSLCEMRHEKWDATDERKRPWDWSVWGLINWARHWGTDFMVWQCTGTLCQTLIFLAESASHEQRAQITRHIEWASCCVSDTKEVFFYYKERHQVECSLRWLLSGHEPTTINQYHAFTGQSKNNYVMDMEQNQRCSDREKTSWPQTCTRKFEASSWNCRLWFRKTH